MVCAGQFHHLQWGKELVLISCTRKRDNTSVGMIYKRLKESEDAVLGRRLPTHTRFTSNAVFSPCEDPCLCSVSSQETQEQSGHAAGITLGAELKIIPPMGRSWCPESNHYRFPALRLEDTVKRVFPPNVTGAGWGGGWGGGGQGGAESGMGDALRWDKAFLGEGRGAKSQLKTNQISFTTLSRSSSNSKHCRDYFLLKLVFWAIRRVSCQAVGVSSLWKLTR